MAAARCMLYRAVTPEPLMNLLPKPTIVALCLALLGAVCVAGCNTMRGLGQDTERAGEKIQDKASR